MEPLPCSFCHDHCQVHFVVWTWMYLCKLPGFRNWDLAWDIGVYVWNLLFMVKSDDKNNCLLQGKWFLTSLDQSPGKCNQKSLQIIICWLGVWLFTVVFECVCFKCQGSFSIFGCTLCAYFYFTMFSFSFCQWPSVNHIASLVSFIILMQ